MALKTAGCYVVQQLESLSKMIIVCIETPFQSFCHWSVTLSTMLRCHSAMSHQIFDAN